MKHLKPSRSALRIAILYAFVAGLQILLFHWPITTLVSAPDQRLLVETFAQVVFLVVITLLLYFLVRGELRADGSRAERGDLLRSPQRTRWHLPVRVGDI